jgi:hypothetical protein
LIDNHDVSIYVYFVQEIDVNQTILIVVGIDIKPEEVDRPLAYKLKGAFESSSHFGNHPFRKCLVISDALYAHDKIIQVCATVAIGGPGVNSVAGEFIEKLPVYLSQENRYFIQLDKDFADLKISIWGMDRKATEEALDMFIANGILEDFLKAIWK